MGWWSDGASLDSSEERAQANLRLDVLKILAVAIFIFYGVRLWSLQVARGDFYAARADENRLRVLPIPAPRGQIYDRNGRLLVGNRTAFNIVLGREDVRSLSEISEILVNRLGVEREELERRLEEAKYEPRYRSIVVKEQVSASDAAWVIAHQYEYPELRLEAAPQRDYLHGSLAAHVLGYVGEVSRSELESGPFSRERGYKMGDIVGKSGLERVYNEILTGRDGARIVIVDSRGRIQEEVERIEPIAGRDIYTTLDLELQRVAEAEADEFPKGRGAIVVMDPNDGGILSLVSRPAFDPNIFSQRAKTPEGRKEILALYRDEDKPLLNRAIQGIYPTGSTWKIFMAVAALNEGAITLEDSRIQDGGLQIGSYFMRSLSHLGRPDIHLAIVKSADGYFYRLGLRMGIERIEHWTEVFRLGQRTGIDLPNERAGIPPSRAWKARVNPRDPVWRDYDTAAASIGQGIAITPLQVLRMVSGVAVGGEMATPHLLRRAAAGVDRLGEWQPAFAYVDEKRFAVPMTAAVHRAVTRAMWSVVNENGTGGRARVEGFDVCGKTGTAQVARTERAGEKNKDHAWFVSFAPLAEPEIAVVVLAENAGFGGTHAAPRARYIYEAYYQRQMLANTPSPELR